MPFLLPLIGLIVGIFVGFNLKNPYWGIFPILFGLAYYIYLLKRSSVPTFAVINNWKHYIWVVVLFCGIGIIVSWVHRPMHIPDNRLGHWALVRGIIDKSTSNTDGDKFIISVKTMSDKDGSSISCRNFKLLLKTQGLSANKGDIIEAWGIIDRIKESQNFRPNGFKERLAHEGIIYTLMTDADHVKLIGFDNSLEARAVASRDKLISRMETSGLNRPTVQFLAALLFGDRSLLPSEVKQKFSNAGIAHVISLSGMHIAVVMGIFLFVLFPLKAVGLHRLRLWIALALIWGYTFFSGMAPSTVRASIMISFVVGATTLQRKNSSMNALLASAIVILLFNPHAIYNVGMQLSFICVAAILAFASTLNTIDRRKHPFIYYLHSAVLISLIATLVTWVLVSYHFKIIPLLFLPANLLLLPIIPIYMSTALCYIGFLEIGINSSLIASILNFVYSFFVNITEIASAYGQATISYQVQFIIVVLWLVGVLILGISMNRNKKSGKIIAISLLAISLCLVPILHKDSPDGMIIQRQFSELAVTVYDGDEESVTVLPRYTVSRLIHKEHEIISIDCEADIDSLLTELSHERKRRKKKYLLIGSNAGQIEIRKILKWGGFEKIILHSSIRRKMEDKIYEVAHTENIDMLYSLREDGPYRLDY